MKKLLIVLTFIILSVPVLADSYPVRTDILWGLQTPQLTGVTASAGTLFGSSANAGWVSMAGGVTISAGEGLTTTAWLYDGAGNLINSTATGGGSRSLNIAVTGGVTGFPADVNQYGAMGRGILAYNQPMHTSGNAISGEQWQSTLWSNYCSAINQGATDNNTGTIITSPRTFLGQPFNLSPTAKATGFPGDVIGAMTVPYHWDNTAGKWFQSSTSFPAPVDLYASGTQLGVLGTAMGQGIIASNIEYHVSGAPYTGLNFSGAWYKAIIPILAESNGSGVDYATLAGSNGTNVSAQHVSLCDRYGNSLSSTNTNLITSLNINDSGNVNAQVNQGNEYMWSETDLDTDNAIPKYYAIAVNAGDTCNARIIITIDDNDGGQWELYEGAVIGGAGTVITDFNVNRLMPDSATTVVTADCNTTTAGSIIKQNSLPARGKYLLTGTINDDKIPLRGATVYVLKITTTNDDVELGFELVAVEEQ